MKTEEGNSEESEYEEERPKKKAKKNRPEKSRMEELMEEMVAEMARSRKELRRVRDALGVLAYVLDKEYEGEEMSDVEYSDDEGIPTIEEEMAGMEMEGKKKKKQKERTEV